jgi:hypothetical protein
VNRISSEQAIIVLFDSTQRPVEEIGIIPGDTVNFDVGRSQHRLAVLGIDDFAIKLFDRRERKTHHLHVGELLTFDEASNGEQRLYD